MVIVPKLFNIAVKGQGRQTWCDPTSTVTPMCKCVLK